MVQGAHPALRPGDGPAHGRGPDVDDLGKQLEQRGIALGPRLPPELRGHVEEVWGWEAYDDLLLDFVRRLKAFQTDGIVPGGTLLPAVRALRRDHPLHQPGRRRLLEGPTALGQKAAELDQLIRGYLAERADVSARFRSFVGSGAHHEGSRSTASSGSIYRGIQEARDQVTRKTVRAEIRGGELLQDVDLAPRHPPGLPAGLRSRDREHDRHGGALARPARQRVRERRDALLARRAHGAAGAARARLPPALARGGGRGQPEAADLPEPLARRRPRIRSSWGPSSATRSGSLGLEPDRIVLEITERTYAVYEGLFREVLSKFRSQNFRIAVDDVGTGYSNLSSLADIEPDYLKFDNVFVRGIDRRQVKQDLLEALMSFARKMHTKVIAEGIETREELRVLQSLGVPYGQGFLLARPMPVDEIERFASIAI